MPYYRPQVITKRQARRQVSILGIALIIYLIFTLLLRYGPSLLETWFPSIFMGYDPELVTMAVTMIVLVLITAVVFGAAASKLRLDLLDYLRKPRISIGKMTALICVGIGISLLVTAVPSLFYFMVHTDPTPFSFIGVFTTRNNILKNVVYFALTVLLKPVCDEIIFRGIVQRQIGHYNRYLGVFASAILYACSFMTLTDAISGLFIGFYLAAVNLRYHSIRPAIVIHFNIALFAWLLNIIPPEYVLIPTILIVIVYIIAGLALFTRVVNIGIIHGVGPANLWKIVFTSPTIIIYILLFTASIIWSFIA